ncbi:DUF4041 domain-containing protein [Clostridium beijerinckii]|jgi:Chromosome segregation ATPases|uniref:Bacteriophage T5 Orf172 DNA-binding domain-containing protein n=2 Tax=Clostridium beijerinckii TaxID=1520 RepID=A6LVT1_CLOB8|nr:DUF4041 domain-containing protein [Clostridium beijerinckii]ABR34461.1 hypothetical protein Cbei_2301 [Clostridium beijerinckii NCIMB 8052]AIU01092.1 hypothetical protein Cbs_2301 [Clostridium beijerinckii ATCC 35702]NOW91646.1 hypothetical protein [Clostridium beijerinckii]NRT24204.1 hypothetical protein [Clostridium beijerinckii]NRT68210.1 hypothetical protein [Clostridium beijerinckii]
MSFLDIFKSESSKAEIENLRTQYLKAKEIIIDKENKIIELKRLIELKEEKYKEAYEKSINLNLEIEQGKENITKAQIEIATLKKYIEIDKEKYREVYEENVKLKLENTKGNEINISLEDDIVRLKSYIEQEKEKKLEILKENSNLKLESEKREKIIESNEIQIINLQKYIEDEKEKFMELCKDTDTLKLQNKKYEEIIVQNENNEFKYKEQISVQENINKECRLQDKKLSEKISEYENILSDADYHKVKDIKNYIIKLENDKCNVEKVINSKQSDLKSLNQNIEELEKKVIVLDDEILYQSFGLYTPMYDFANSEEYKDELTKIRDIQKEILKDNKAASNVLYWGIDINADKDPKLVRDNVKQMIRCFNSECDAIINKVKFNNMESIRNRIEKSYDSLNKINKRNGIEISDEYLNLKYEELKLAHEYNLKIQEEKEERRRLLEDKREEVKLLKEIEEKKRDLEKEKMHYDNVMRNIQEQIKNEQSEERLKVLLNKKNDLENNLCDVDKALKEVDYREANYKAGYVYIISNIGAFGKNVYKIGMTRRLEPQDRIDELGNASVPFKFDVHAMIFSDDAPKLESAIHRAFESKKINVVNGRKEFFKVTLEEVEKVVKANYDKSVDFVKIPEAQQYRESLKIKGI